MACTNLEQEHAVLFWIFIGFFLVIGIVSLLAILGLISIEERFRKWAITGFFVPVIGVMIPLARDILTPANLSLDLNVMFEPPKDVQPEPLVLVSGSYEYTKQSPSEEAEKLTGKFEPMRPAGPYWQAVVPYLPPAPGKTYRSAKLTLEDNTGRSWVAGFDPRYIRANINLLTQAPPNHALNYFFKLPLIKSASASTPPTTDPPKQTGDQNSTCQQYPNEIKFNNWAKPTGEQYGGKDYYRWRVFVDEDNSVLDCVEEVQYMLHPSFPNPLQIQRDRGKRFAVEMSGWGVFSIDITVKLTNGATLNTSYALDFGKTWP